MAVKCSSCTHTCIMVVRVENITRGGKTQHRESLRGQKFPGGACPQTPLNGALSRAIRSLRLILMQSGRIWEVKIVIIFHLFFYDKELQLAKITC